MSDIEALFKPHGGEFLASPIEITSHLKDVKAFLFDWDGVFNTGEKDNEGGSSFTEGDAMGINMLRFSFSLLSVDLKVFIVTGETNPLTRKLVDREHFDGAFFSIKDKSEVLPVLEKEFGVGRSECAFVYDDILDLALARLARLRFFIRKGSNPMLNDFILREGLCEYVTGHPGGLNAVREICELVMALNGNYDTTIVQRSEMSETYRQYFSKRNKIVPAYYRRSDQGIVPLTQ